MSVFCADGPSQFLRSDCTSSRMLDRDSRSCTVRRAFRTSRTVVDRGNRLVGSRIAHPSPGVGSVRNHDSELERTEPCFVSGLAWKTFFNFWSSEIPVDHPAGVCEPPGCAWEKLNTSKQARHASHVTVAVTFDFVTNAVQDKHLIAVRFQRFQNWLDVEVRPLPVRPELLLNGPVRTEHHNEAFFP